HRRRHIHGGSSARPRRPKNRGATPPTQPSSTAAIRWLNKERKALPIISQFNDGDGEYVPHSQWPPSSIKKVAALRISDWFSPQFVRNWSAACAMSSCGERTTHVQPTAMNARLQARPRRAGIWRAVGWALLILLAIAGRAAAQTAVDLQLVLAVDASGTLSHVGFDRKKRAYVAAFRHARVLQAIRSGPSRAIAVTMVQWTGPMLQVQVVGWTLVGDEESAAAFAAAIERAPRQLFGGGTSISGAI